MKRKKFEPITLSATADAPLIVETKYTRTGNNFILELPSSASEEWVLTPENLGLVEVVVDAEAAKLANAKKAQIQFYYKPAGEGIRDRRVLNFNTRDPEWIERWYLITKSIDLDGIIEWSWTVTPERGSTIKQRTVETNNTKLSL